MSYNAVDAAASLQQSLAFAAPEIPFEDERPWGVGYAYAITEFEDGASRDQVSFWILGSGESMRVTVERIRPWGDGYDVPDWKYQRPSKTQVPEREATHALQPDGSLQYLGEGTVDY